MKWIDERPEYYVQTGAMHENPWGVPKSEIIRMIMNNPPEVVAQVIFGKYVESSGLVFTGELIQNFFDRSIPVVQSQTYVDQYALDIGQQARRRHGDWGRWFATGVDFARQTDFTVITTLDIRQMPARVVYWRRLNRVPWDAIYAEVGRAAYMFGPNILVDSSGPAGDVILDAIENRWYCPIHHRVINSSDSVCTRDGKEMKGCGPGAYIGLANVSGFVFTQNRKRELIEHLRNTMSVGYDGSAEEYGLIRCPPIPQLEEELAFYSWDDKKLMTDCVFSLALAAWEGIEELVVEPEYGSVYGQ